MSIIGEFAELMTDSITYSSRTGTNSYGAATYGTAVAIAAWIESTNDMVITKDGREVRSSKLIIVAGSTVDVDGRLQIGDTDYTMLSVNTPRDETGLHHQEIRV